jgi:glycosyltransferase involved in cell wall biosynthesis
MESINSINNSPLLSICIPTYNRGSVLELCIKSIITQKSFDNRTEIIILDNNSSDNTYEIVKKYTNKYTNILYFKNEENIGMEKNILKVLKFGKGKLLKLLNDYTLIIENKLEVILEQINSNHDESTILYFQNKSNKIDNISCFNLDTFFRLATYWPTWIGTFSVWKKDYDKIEKTTVFEGLLFPHLLMLLSVFKLKKSIRFINEKLFNETVGIKKGGYDFFEVFIKNFIGTIIHGAYLKKEINFKTLLTVKLIFFNKFLRIWIINIFINKNSNFNSKNFGLVFKYFKFYPQLYLLIFSCVKKLILLFTKKLINQI